MKKKLIRFSLILLGLTIIASAFFLLSQSQFMNAGKKPAGGHITIVKQDPLEELRQMDMTIQSKRNSFAHQQLILDAAKKLVANHPNIQAPTEDTVFTPEETLLRKMWVQTINGYRQTQEELKEAVEKREEFLNSLEREIKEAIQK